MPLTPKFHLAIPVQDLASTRAFYGELLGCKEGRSAERWVDFDFFGHQLSAHLAPKNAALATNPVDGDAVPVPHFGVILEWSQWHQLAERLQHQGISFVIAPRIRFQGLTGEQATMFFLDPSGNALEFKAFQDELQLFAKQEPTYEINR